MNCETFGRHLVIETSGASHDPFMELVIKNFPKGINIDYNLIDRDLARRRPHNEYDTQRKERDTYHVLSGINKGVTDGGNIVIRVDNGEMDGSKYDYLKNFYRPSHADFVYEKKYGETIPNGGGRFSARETVTRVIAGSFAKMLINEIMQKSAKGEIEFQTWAYSIGDIVQTTFKQELNSQMKALLMDIKSQQDSIGGSVRCIIKNFPAGVGEPVFNKLHAALAYGMMGIPAARAFEIGRGVEAGKMRGSQHNDPYISDERTNTIRPAKNDAGGIIGGISTGEDIILTVHFKPIASIMQPQHTVNKKGENDILQITGYHDVCCVPRAVPVVEAMAAIVLADELLGNCQDK